MHTYDIDQMFLTNIFEVKLYKMTSSSLLCDTVIFLAINLLILLMECHFAVIFEPPRDKTNKMACAPSGDSDQSGHPVRMKKA